jgi:K+:H+ antiporter
MLDLSRPEGPDDTTQARVDAAHRAVVIGYGPTGRTVTRLLQENGFEATIVDLNVNTVRELREQNIRAVYGDATHRDTLLEAGVGQADSLVLTSAGMAESRETIRIARELNPRIHVQARAGYLRDVPGLRAAGAQAVVSAEGEVALALTETILQRFGATPDQIDHERERVRSELHAS